MRKGWLSSEAWNILAVPWKPPWTELGTPISPMARRIASSASDKVFPGARLKESVVATNCD